MSAVAFPLHPWVSVSDVGPEQTGTITQDLRSIRFDMFTCVPDDNPKTYYIVPKKYTDPLVWDALAIGTRVKFRLTMRFPCIVELAVIP